MKKMNRFTYSRDHFAIAFGLFLVLITLLLVIDLQAGFNLSNDYLPLPEHDLNDIEQFNHDKELLEKRISEENNVESDGIDTITAIKDKIGNFRKYIGSRSSSKDIGQMLEETFQKNDQFQDIYEASEYITFRKSQLPKNEADFLALSDLVEYDKNNLTILDKFNLEMKQNEIYSENSKTVAALIQEMAIGKIVKNVQKEGGTQIKMIMEYESGISAMVKPMRYPRDQQTLPDHIYYADYERHSAEIAAFHLDRILGFRRAFPVTGRLMNMTSEIYELVETDVKKTFFVSQQPDSNLCFYGVCRRYCDIFHPVCSANGMLEGAFIAFYPLNFNIEFKSTRHPWRRSYSVNRKAAWELALNYCERVKVMEPFTKGRRLLDLMDLSILDFLAGNMDRHHYAYFSTLGDEAFTVHYDNGRGFGRPFHDEISALAPLIHCCMIRHTTIETLLKLHNGPKPLSQLLKESMASDPIAPVLWEPHYEAMDRRVVIILNAVRECIQRKAPHDVIYPGLNIEDKF